MEPRYRIARLVHERLIEARELELASRIDSASILSTELGRLQQMQSKLLLARQRGYLFAARCLMPRVGRLIADLRYGLDNAQRQLQRPNPPVPSMRQLVEELDQISSEFEEWGYARRHRAVWVRIEPIELEGIYLGPFEIRLLLDDLGAAGRRPAYRVIALDPQPAAGSSHVTHPHVSDENLCAGEATTTLNSALAEGRLCDFFLMVQRILETYNPESPYVALDRWEGENCPECGYAMGEEDRYYCENCEQDFCFECISQCRCCELSFCYGCLTTCEGCDEPNCSDCMMPCSRCNKPFCKSCLEDELCPDCKEKQDDEENKEESREETRESHAA